MEAGDDKPKVYELSEVDVAGLGDKAKEVGAIITEISKPLFEKPPKQLKEGDDAEEDEEDEFDEDDDETMSGIEQKMAADIKKTLDSKLGQNWNALVGNRFSTLINLREGDKQGKFKFGSVCVHIFQMNNY